MLGVVSDKNICDEWVWMHIDVLYVWIYVCISVSDGLSVQDMTSKLCVWWLCFILANEEAENVLLGHSGNMRSEVTSKAG